MTPEIQSIKEAIAEKLKEALKAQKKGDMSKYSELWQEMEELNEEYNWLVGKPTMKHWHY